MPEGIPECFFYFIFPECDSISKCLLFWSFAVLLTDIYIYYPATFFYKRICPSFTVTLG